MDVQAYCKIFEPEGRDILQYTWTSINYDYSNVVKSLFVFYYAWSLSKNNIIPKSSNSQQVKLPARKKLQIFFKSPIFIMY